MAVGALWSALRGGLAFLARLPVGAVETDWRQFQGVPAVFPAVGYLVGGFAAVSFVELGPHAAALSFLLVLVAVVGVTHLDGIADIADIADAAVVHDAATPPAP